MKSSVLDEDFEGTHKVFTDAMQASMLDLKTEGVELLRLTATTCKDGDVSPEESATIEAHIRAVKDRQAAMHSAYLKISQSQPYVTRDLSNENIFAFSLACWARKIGTFA